MTFLGNLYPGVNLYAVTWTQEEESWVQGTLVLNVKPSQAVLVIDCLCNWKLVSPESKKKNTWTNSHFTNKFDKLQMTQLKFWSTITQQKADCTLKDPKITNWTSPNTTKLPISKSQNPKSTDYQAHQPQPTKIKLKPISVN